MANKNQNGDMPNAHIAPAFLRGAMCFTVNSCRSNTV